MRDHNICFNGEILKIIPELSLLLLIWNPEGRRGQGEGAGSECNYFGRLDDKTCKS